MVKNGKVDDLIISNNRFAAELIIANTELSFQNIEKEKRAAELIIANKELSFQNAEKEKRAAELIIANKELSFQNAEKEKRAAELFIANVELSFQNAEKEKRAAELFIANQELSFQIKERKNAEQSLKESIDKFMSLADNITGYIAYINADSLHYEFVNDMYVKSYGIPIEKIIGSHIKDILGETNYQIAIKYINKAKSGESISFENIFDFASGSRWLQVNYTPVFNAKGQVTSIAVVNFDVTERKQAEKALKENEKKLLQIDADKNRFISILSHDLKSPFNSLLGFSEALLKNMRLYNIDEIEDCVTYINKSARSTYYLLEDILMWARTQQGRIPFNPQILNFRDICIQILGFLSPNADEKNIIINYSGGEKLTVFADIDMFKTIMRNLVSNAIKFTNKGGVINIYAEEIYGELTITVSDNGIGISHDDLTKLFDITQILSNPGTEQETGTGLGLLLCKEFVEKHGGKISVNSEYGRGSDFKITLPMNTDQSVNISN